MHEREKNSVAIQALREQADQQELESEACKAKSEMFTEALKRLEIYKAELCKDIPIEGLDLSGGDVIVNGLPWRKLNTAQQLKISVKVCALRLSGKPLHTLLVDNAERLDKENRRILCRELLAAGIDAFVFVVTDSDFRIVPFESAA
jgi:hypothetical protein